MSLNPQNMKWSPSNSRNRGAFEQRVVIQDEVRASDGRTFHVVYQDGEKVYSSTRYGQARDERAARIETLRRASSR